MSVEERKRKKKRKMRNRFIYRTVILAVLVGALLFAIISSIQGDNPVYREGDKAPDFQLKQISKQNDLETIQLSDFEGQGVMLNFWGTWCGPCEYEMPFMEELYPEYKEKGVEILAVTLDTTELAVHNFVERHDLTFPIPHDTTGEIKDLYQVKPLPSSFFINPEGEIEEVVIGALSLDNLRNYLDSITPQ